MLCKYGVVGKFVEFYGDGLDLLLLVDCVIIVNMLLEYGVICGFFLIDVVIFDYMCLSGCSEDQVELVEKYVKVQGMWCNLGDELIFISMLELDMNDVEVSLVGFKCLQDCVVLFDVLKVFVVSNELEVNVMYKDCQLVDYVMNGYQYQLFDGAVVIVVIILCINIFNLSVLMVVGLLVKKVVILGFKW